MSIKENINLVLSEITQVLEKVDSQQVEGLANLIVGSERVVCCGAGRVGMATRAFSMRLKHLGKDAYFIGDSNVPSIGLGDLLLVSSGSGETQTIYDLVVIAKKNGAKIGLVTGNPKSRIGRLSDNLVEFKVPSKAKSSTNITSKQPMTSLNEQCLWVFYDALVLEIMKMEGVNESYMKKRHSILE